MTGDRSNHGIGKTRLSLAGMTVVGSGRATWAVQEHDRSRSTGDEDVLMTEERILTCAMSTPTDRSEAWRAWTPAEGVADLLAPAQARIELRPGGPYEIYFAPSSPEGSRESQGGKVPSHAPHETLAFEGNAPPSIPLLRQAGAKTVIIVQFQEKGPSFDPPRYPRGEGAKPLEMPAPMKWHGMPAHETAVKVRRTG